jgi:uncharacterized glyoxalase superfamily protein PhnB
MNEAARSVVPMLAYEDAATAIDWLTAAFGFREQREVRHAAADGTVTHAQLQHDGGSITLSTPTPDYRSPSHHRETCAEADRWLRVPWVIDGVFAYVGDIEAHFARAKAAGATMLSGIEVAPFGRLHRTADLEGHRWMFAQSKGRE